MPADNSAHLRAAAQRHREQTLQRARDALRQLEAGGRPVIFELVARAAGVSRAWLYSQPDIRQAVQQLRGAHRLAPADPSPPRNALPMPASCAGWKAAHTRNRELATEIRQLREQLARAHGQLRAARLMSAPPTGVAGSSP